ncbi:hypothetical protein LTR08_007002 [Meristemomyces frigidus]|nr:hypothetical protein LTR08_007002 [Meristemomyces frigidus]
MASGVRDPAFWKRFSYAVHMDEELIQKPELRPTDSWINRQNAKRSRRTYVCCAFWISFFLLIAGVVAVVIWLLKSGVLNKVKIGNGSGTTYQPADPNSGVNSKRDVVEDVAADLAKQLLRRYWAS